jgi:hypothetical protein
VFDPETFLTELYVLVDEFCKQQSAPVRPGPAPALTESEVLTLALFSHWASFGSERAFYRYAARHLRPLFPTLPSRPQFNRLVRRCHDRLAAFALHLGQYLAATDRAFEILDGTGVPTRNVKRRGAGWLPEVADIGKCTRLGWYEGVRLLLAVTPQGAITGFGLGSASTNDRTLAETFFALRAQPEARLLSVGQPVSDCYVADMGFGGVQCEERWAAHYGATIVCPAQTGSTRAVAWSKPWRTWLAGIRQVIETVNDRLLTTFGLTHERPHAWDGLQARLAARVGLHNICLWFNQQRDRSLLTIADLIDW